MLPRRRLGRSTVEVAPFALGTLPLSPLCGGTGYGVITNERADAMLGAALGVGIDLIVASDRFAPNGAIEGWLGEHLAAAAARVGRDAASVRIASTAGASGDPKLPMRTVVGDHLIESVQASLVRLGRTTLDLCLLDDPPLRLVVTGEASDGLLRVCDAGLARAIGVSVHAPQEAIAVAEEGRVDVVCLPYSLLFPEAGLEALDAIVASGMTPLVREVLANGFLGGRQQPHLPRPPSDLRSRWPSAMGQGRTYAAEYLRGIGAPGCTLPQSAVRFVLDHPAIHKAGVSLLGVRSGAQLEELLGANDLPSIPVDHLQQLAQMIRRPLQGTVRVEPQR